MRKQLANSTLVRLPGGVYGLEYQGALVWRSGPPTSQLGDDGDDGGGGFDFSAVMKDVSVGIQTAGTVAKVVQAAQSGQGGQAVSAALTGAQQFAQSGVLGSGAQGVAHSLAPITQTVAKLTAPPPAQTAPAPTQPVPVQAAAPAQVAPAPAQAPSPAPAPVAAPTPPLPSAQHHFHHPVRAAAPADPPPHFHHTFHKPIPVTPAPLPTSVKLIAGGAALGVVALALSFLPAVHHSPHKKF